MPTDSSYDELVMRTLQRVDDNLRELRQETGHTAEKLWGRLDEVDDGVDKMGSDLMEKIVLTDRNIRNLIAVENADQNKRIRGLEKMMARISGIAGVLGAGAGAGVMGGAKYLASLFK